MRLPEIAISTRLPEEPIYAMFDQRLMSQCLTNLIKNAVEAIEAAGIETIAAPLITVEGQIEGDTARVSVSDNGRGWPADNRHRLLEPYMTTREKGTGLGLAIVAKIIEQHDGTVDLVDAEPDASGRIGACFTFTLRLPSAFAQAEGMTDAENQSDLNEEPRVSAVANS